MGRAFVWWLLIVAMLGGCCSTPGILRKVPVEIAVVAEGNGYGQGTLLPGGEVLLTKHQLELADGVTSRSGFIYIGERASRFTPKYISERSDIAILQLDSVPAATGAIPFRCDLPLERGMRAYIVCYKPPAKPTTSYQDLLERRGEPIIVSGALDVITGLSGDSESFVFVPDSQYAWVKLAPGISGAPVIVNDPNCGLVIIGVNSSSIPVSTIRRNGRSETDRVKLVARP